MADARRSELIRRGDSKGPLSDLAVPEHGVPSTSFRRGDRLRDDEEKAHEEAARPGLTSLLVHLADGVRRADLRLRPLRVLAGPAGAVERLPDLLGDRRRALQLHTAPGVPEIYDCEAGEHNR